MNKDTVAEIPNYGKLAMLHRMQGCLPLSVYAGSREDTQKLYKFLQQWCNNSRDLACTEHEITTRNPMLAWHLLQFVKTQSLVAPSDYCKYAHDTATFL